MATQKNKYAVAFGKVLKEQRLAAELTQEELAEKADLERTFVSFMERGERQPTLTTIVRVAKALGIGADELVRLATAGPDKGRR